MTFAEKARKEHPELCDQELGYPASGCPHHKSFGYEEYQGPAKCIDMSCRDCWNREIPEEKPKKRSRHQQVADFLWNMYVAFKEAGFEADKAFDLTKVAYEVIVEEYHKS